MMRKILLLNLLLLSQLAFSQFKIPEKPTLDNSLIFDYADVLNPTEEQALNEKLIQYERTTSTQIVVATVPSINDDDINLVGAEWGEKWGIGQGKIDNGLLILLATQDRKMSIQNGRGLEPFLTDWNTKKIIEQYFFPNLKQNNYYQAINQGSDGIFSLLNGEFKETNPTASDSSDWGGMIFFFVLIIFLLIIFSRGNNDNSGSNNGRRRGFGRDVIFTDYGSRSWRGGGFFGGGSSGGSSGGFGGFGGGSFGGGGASGSW